MRIPKKELEALSSAVEYFEEEGLPLFAPLRSLLDRLDSKAKDISEGGPTPAQIENCLVMYSKGKVVPIVGGHKLFWIKQYNQWRNLKVTLEQVEKVARWLGKQGWMSPTTVDQVAYKWPSYLGRANANELGSSSKASKPTGTARVEFEGEG